MADKLKKLTGKSKKMLIIIAVIVVIIVAFLYLNSGSSPTESQNRTTVSDVPNIANVPGGKVSPEYYKALLQSNQVAAEKAQALGQTSVSTLVNTDTPGFQQSANACTQKCCNCETPTVKDTVAGWLATGKISKETADTLADLNKKNLSEGDYANALQQLVKEGKLTPEQARALLEQYKKAHAAETAQASANTMDPLIQSGTLPLDAANSLLDLQKNGASVDTYAQELASLVKSGKLSKETAAKLLADYKKEHGGLETVGLDQLISTSLPSSFTAGTYNTQALVNPNVSQRSLPGNFKQAKPQFQDAQVANQATTAQEQALLQAREQQIQTLSASMTTQASGIIKGNEPTVQAAMVAAPDTTIVRPDSDASDNGGAAGSSSNNQPPIVKAGDIEFAVLDTAVDSDYPTSPVMATIVQGRLKGGRLIGQLSKGGNADNDRVILSFNLLNMPNWPKPVNVTAVAIDPESARSALATSVNYHYLTRYGALFASAFLAGYGQTFTQAGQVVIPGTQGQGNQPYIINSQTMSPSARIFAGLGQVGTQSSTAAQQYFNMPPTVKVQSGVGLGILFMENVSSTDQSSPPSQQPAAPQVSTGVSATPGQEVSQQVTQSNNK